MRESCQTGSNGPEVMRMGRTDEIRWITSFAG